MTTSVYAAIVSSPYLAWRWLASRDTVAAIMLFLRGRWVAPCTITGSYLGLAVVATGSAMTAFAQPSEISLDFRESASSVDVHLSILEGESAQETIELCLPSCPDWATGLVDGDLEFNLYRLETNVPGAQGYLAIGESGLSIEISDATAGDRLFGEMTLFVDEPLIDLLEPVTVELLFSVEDSIFDSLSTTVEVINLADGGSDGDRFFFSGSPPPSVSFPLFLPEDDPPLDPFAVRSSFALSGNSHARVTIESVRVGFFIPKPSAIHFYLFGALGLLRPVRDRSAFP